MIEQTSHLIDVEYTRQSPRRFRRAYELCGIGTDPAARGQKAVQGAHRRERPRERGTMSATAMARSDELAHRVHIDVSPVLDAACSQKREKTVEVATISIAGMRRGVFETAQKLPEFGLQLAVHAVQSTRARLIQGSSTRVTISLRKVRNSVPISA